VFLLFAWGWKEGNAHHIEREHQLARRISTAVTLLRAGRLKRLQERVARGLGYSLENSLKIVYFQWPRCGHFHGSLVTPQAA